MIGSRCSNRHSECPGPQDCARPETQCCHGTVTSEHPTARSCVACHLQGSPSARRQRERERERPTVGRILAPRLELACMPVRVEPGRRRGETPEHAVLVEVQAALARVPGLKVMRNSVGMARAAHGRMPYGLGVGSADLVGILAPGGRWCCWEVKAPGGKPTPAQLAWIDRMRSLGALVGVVRSGAEALAVLEGRS